MYHHRHDLINADEVMINAPSVATFKQRLTTFLFTQSFDV